MKLAIVTTRFIDGDMRGGEEMSRTLFYFLKEKTRVSLLASDMLSESYNLKDRRRNSCSGLVEGDGDVILFKTHFSSQRAVQILGQRAVRVLERGIPNGISRKSLFAEIAKSFAWGPFAPGIYNAIKGSDYDVVFSSIFPTATALISLKASVDSGKPFVFTPYFHYAVPEHRNSTLIHFYTKRSSALIACTESEKKALIDTGAIGEKIYVIPLSFDVSTIPLDLPPQESLKESMGLKDYFVVLTHPWIQKGAIEVLKSVSMLVDRGKKVAVISIGKPDKEYVAEETRLVSRNLNLKILDLGWLQGRKKWEAFSACDVFALPSRSDAFGISYLNAWALKKTVLAAKNTPAGEIVDDGINGMLVDPGNPENLALTLDNLINSDIRDMGKSGYQKLLASYSPNDMSERYLRVFESVIR